MYMKCCLSKQMVLLVMLLQFGSPTQDTGTIKGTVVDSADNPIKGAQVHIAEEGGFKGHRLVQMFYTDNHGAFTIPKVAWGSYVVLAGKQEDGYPDTTFAFYSNLQTPKVSISPNAPVQSVVLNLGQKAGILKIEHIFDSRSKKQVDTAVIRLERVSDSAFFISLSAKDVQVAIPSNVDIRLRITAPGFQDWPSTSAGFLGLRLAPGEVRKMSIELSPSQ